MGQKAMGRSFKSWTNNILDLLGVESMVERSSFGARTKSVMKDLYQAARQGLTEKDCAITYNKCPVAVAIEPLRNSVFSKVLSRPHPQHVPRPVPTAAQIIYGPSKMKVDTNNNNNNNNAKVIQTNVPVPQAMVEIVPIKEQKFEKFEVPQYANNAAPKF